ncbi:MAG: hypothetical protein JO359_10900, partial [Candidatus Eremiobacteraeota bacterium]|nr:hypothetical protein [Candidatus Eremiobacteraeota bacterium]
MAGYERFGALLLTVALLSGCAGFAAQPTPESVAPSNAQFAHASIPLQHLVIVVQENRSFDNIFAGFPGADAPTFGKLPNKKTLVLRTVSMNTEDPEHSFQQSLAEIDGGKMDGFAADQLNSGPPYNPPVELSRLDPQIAAPYWSMAKSYTLADRMFPTEHGPSWTAHINLVAGTTAIDPTTAI